MSDWAQRMWRKAVEAAALLSPGARISLGCMMESEQVEALAAAARVQVRRTLHVGDDVPPLVYESADARLPGGIEIAWHGARPATVDDLGLPVYLSGTGTWGTKDDALRRLVGVQ